MRISSALYRRVFRFIGGDVIWEEVFMMNCNLPRSFDQVHRASLIARREELTNCRHATSSAVARLQKVSAGRNRTQKHD